MAWFSALLATLFIALDPAAFSGPGVLALLVTAVCVVALGCAARHHRPARFSTAPARTRPRVVGRRADPGYYLLLRDPCIPGSPRPRAPGTASAAA
jgi:hypothetical protein